MLYSAGYFIYVLQLLQFKSHCTIEVHQVEAFRILAFDGSPDVYSMTEIGGYKVAPTKL